MTTPDLSDNSDVNNVDKTLDKKRNDWHVAFVAAWQLDFEDAKERFEFDMETKLPTGHLNCDIIIHDKYPNQSLP
ncbi:MAG: hypothetical protein LBB88_04420, partial [Planctomycetaceae bacterium]|nr:hypothetical protein [Planctomycetaceae bacterium]